MKERRASVKLPGPEQRPPSLGVIVRQQSRAAKSDAHNLQNARNRAFRSEVEAERGDTLAGEIEKERMERNERDIARAGEDSMSPREQNRIALLIVEFIWKNLDSYPRPRSRKSVLGRVLDHTCLCADVLNYVLPKKLAGAQQEILHGVCIRLDEVRSANSACKLAIKHAILDAMILEQGDFSARQVARVLRIHHRDVFEAVVRREVLHSAREILFSLSVRAKRVDGLAVDERCVIFKWWILKTRMSPNKKDMARKRISISARDEKPTHYLQESHVCTLKPA